MSATQTSHVQADTTDYQADDRDPMARVAADIAAADEMIRKAREEAAAARRAAGVRYRYRADVAVMWHSGDGGWKKAFAAKLTIPSPTVSSLHLLIEFLVVAFGQLRRNHEVAIAAVTDDPETHRHVVAYSHVGISQ